MKCIFGVFKFFQKTNKTRQPVEFFRSLFGRIENTKIYFRNLPTFRPSLDAIFVNLSPLQSTRLINDWKKLLEIIQGVGALGELLINCMFSFFMFTSWDGFSWEIGNISSQKMAKFCLRSCWMTPKLFFTKIEFLGFRCTMIYQCFLLRLDCPGPFHKIMTVSNEKFDYILSHWVWQHCKNIAVTSQNNPIERIFEIITFLFSARKIWRLKGAP